MHVSIIKDMLFVSTAILILLLSPLEFCKQTEFLMFGKDFIFKKKNYLVHTTHVIGLLAIYRGQGRPVPQSAPT